MASKECAVASGKLAGQVQSLVPSSRPTQRSISHSGAWFKMSPTTTQAALLMPSMVWSRYQQMHHPRIRSWSHEALELGLSKQNWLFNQFPPCLNSSLGFFRDSGSARVQAMISWVVLPSSYVYGCQIPDSIIFFGSPNKWSFCFTISPTWRTTSFYFFNFLTFWRPEFKSHYFLCPYVWEARTQILLLHHLNSKSNYWLSSNYSFHMGFFYPMSLFSSPCQNTDKNNNDLSLWEVYCESGILLT